MTMESIIQAVSRPYDTNPANKQPAPEKTARPDAAGQHTIEDVEDVVSLSPEGVASLSQKGQQGGKLYIQHDGHRIELDDDYLALMELEGEAYMEAVIDKVFDGKAGFFILEELPLEQQLEQQLEWQKERLEQDRQKLEQDRQEIEGNLLSEYYKEERIYQKTKHEQHTEIYERLHQKMGGLLDDGLSYSYDNGDYTKPISIKTSSGSPHPKAGPIAAFLRAHAAELQEIDRLQSEARNFMSFEEWKAKLGQPYVDEDKQIYDNLEKLEAEVRQLEAEVRQLEAEMRRKPAGL